MNTEPTPSPDAELAIDMLAELVDARSELDSALFNATAAARKLAKKAADCDLPGSCLLVSLARELLNTLEDDADACAIEDILRPWQKLALEGKLPDFIEQCRGCTLWDVSLGDCVARQGAQLPCKHKQAIPPGCNCYRCLQMAAGSMYCRHHKETIPVPEARCCASYQPRTLPPPSEQPTLTI